MPNSGWLTTDTPQSELRCVNICDRLWKASKASDSRRTDTERTRRTANCGTAGASSQLRETLPNERPECDAGPSCKRHGARDGRAGPRRRLQRVLRPVRPPRCPGRNRSHAAPPPTAHSHLSRLRPSGLHQHTATARRLRGGLPVATGHGRRVAAPLPPGLRALPLPPSACARRGGHTVPRGRRVRPFHCCRNGWAATRPPRRRHEPLVTEGLHAALSPTRCPSLSKAALAPWPLLRHTGTLPLWGSTSASPSARPPGAAPAATSPRERPPR